MTVKYPGIKAGAMGGFICLHFIDKIRIFFLIVVGKLIWGSNNSLTVNYLNSGRGVTCGTPLLNYSEIWRLMLNIQCLSL